MLEQAEKNRLLKLVELSREEIGNSEENVKQKFVVPLMEIFGHNRNVLDFEYASKGKRIDIYIKGLPHDCKVVIDTKSYEEDLENHIEQIATYAIQEGALIALIANGEEIRAYSPMRGYSFRDSLLYCFKRKELSEEENQNVLEKFIGRNNLSNRETREFVRLREEEIVDLQLSIERLQGQFEQKRNEIEQQISRLSSHKNEIEKEIKNLTIQYGSLDIEKLKEVGKLYAEIQLPQMAVWRSSSIIEDEKSINGSEAGKGKLLRNEKRVEITLQEAQDSNEPSWKKYKLIPIPKEIREFFPGKGVAFTLDTDIGLTETWIVGGSGKDGDLQAGSYFSRRLGGWYGKHRNLKPGDILLISKVGEKRYKLEIKN